MQHHKWLGTCATKVVSRGRYSFRNRAIVAIILRNHTHLTNENNYQSFPAFVISQAKNKEVNFFHHDTKKLRVSFNIRNEIVRQFSKKCVTCISTHIHYSRAFCFSVWKLACVRSER